MPAYLRPLSLLAIIGLLSGCPFGRGHAKPGEKCRDGHDCETFQCACADGGVGNCGYTKKTEYAGICK